MAIYHLEAAIISRGKGQSAVAAAAYEARERIKSELDGNTKNYTQKGGLIASGIIAPENAAPWMMERATLWNGVEKHEFANNKRFATAQYARRFIYAVPAELSKEEQIALTKEIAESFVKRGMIADYALHEPDTGGDRRNIHAHFMTTLRDISNNEFSNKNREWNTPEYLKGIREEICDITNRHLIKYNIQVDHRTLAEQGISRAPTKHLGVNVTAHKRRLKRLEEEAIAIQEEIMTDTPNLFDELKKSIMGEPSLLDKSKEEMIQDNLNKAEIIKAKKTTQQPKTKEELLVFCCIKARPYISQHLMAEQEDLQKRGDNIKKGGFDEHYDRDKRVCNQTRTLFNEARETVDYEKWNKVFHSMYNDPASYPRDNHLQDYKYGNARYTIWEKIRQPYNKLEKELFPKERTQEQTRTQDIKHGRGR